ncbi:hypothetical protein K457DRAFT_133420 [Linnemannia elongata AG-77]|uniref:Uncharacterized protein n=1 Tax=Linnemannia elongata AG-77 TaxID=1314771 RepID=A0A197KB20_9FUNG|nr:hypothetical protein K457DRAFT_133420 [Linnemannia elongata AG-77]
MHSSCLQGTKKERWRVRITERDSTCGRIASPYRSNQKKWKIGRNSQRKRSKEGNSEERKKKINGTWL